MADDFLPEPFAIEGSMARVRALLHRGESAEPVELRSTDFRMDLIQRKTWRRDTEIVLTTMELPTSEYSVRHQERVLAMTPNAVW